VLDAKEHYTMTDIFNISTENLFPEGNSIPKAG
jgi:hypothetical protein